MKKPSKTAAELEASIKVEMEDICDWPTIWRSPFSLMATVGRCGFQVKEVFTVSRTARASDS